MLKTSAIIAFLMVLSVGIRLYHLGARGLSRDETRTLIRVNGFVADDNPELNIEASLPEYFGSQQITEKKNWDNVVEATIDDSGNAIGYNLMLYYWTSLFGNTNTSLRMLSMIFGVLSVLLGYYFCRQLFNARTALIAGVALSLHPVLIDYAQMARSYVPATFFILLTTYSIYQVSVAKRHVWLHIPLYIISLNLSLWCHYVTLYVFVSHIFLVAIFHSHRKALIQYGIMAIAGLGIFSIWLFNGGWEGKRPINIEQSMWQHHQTVNGEAASIVESLSSAGYDMVMNLVRIFGNDLEPSAGRNYGFFALLLLPFAIVFFVFLKVRKSEYFRQVMFVTFPLVMYIIFAIVMVLRTSHSIPFDIRYTIFVMPFACMLLAFGFDRILSQYPKFVVPGYVLIIVVLIVMVAGIFPGLLRKNIPQEKNQFVYHQAAAFLESNANPSDTVIFKTKELAILTNFYFHHELIAIETVDAQSNTGLRIVNGEKQLEFVMPEAN